jgi:hypothetical protein
MQRNLDLDCNGGSVGHRQQQYDRRRALQTPLAVKVKRWYVLSHRHSAHFPLIGGEGKGRSCNAIIKHIFMIFHALMTQSSVDCLGAI